MRPSTAGATSQVMTFKNTRSKIPYLFMYDNEEEFRYTLLYFHYFKLFSGQTIDFIYSHSCPTTHMPECFWDIPRKYSVAQIVIITFVKPCQCYNSHFIISNSG